MLVPQTKKMADREVGQSDVSEVGRSSRSWCIWQSQTTMSSG